MYTVLWTDSNGKDRWERCEDRAEVVSLLNREHLVDDDDVTIFTPEADDCTISQEDLFAAL